MEKGVRRTIEIPGPIYKKLISEKRQSMIKTSVQRIITSILAERYGISEETGGGK